MVQLVRTKKITCWDREISWLQRRSHQGHLAPYTLLHHPQFRRFPSLLLSLFLSHEPPSLPSLVAHPSPNSRLLRIFREVLSSTLLNLERDYYDINFRQSIYCDPRREIRVNARTRICICVIVALCKLLLNRELEYAQPPGASVN